MDKKDKKDKKKEIPLIDKAVVEDVTTMYRYYNDVESDLSKKDLTETSKRLASTSFSKEWDNEDDSYWNNY
ncbi:MAG: hypothetical protein PHT07_05250 [Paludibacter sp.]|nr:hypothetical protein [Paludibacter sp.]